MDREATTTTLTFCTFAIVLSMLIGRTRAAQSDAWYNWRIPPDFLSAFVPVVAGGLLVSIVGSLFFPVSPAARVITASCGFFLLGTHILATRDWQNYLWLVRAMALLVASLTVALAAFIWSLR